MGGPTHVNPPVDDRKADEMDLADTKVEKEETVETVLPSDAPKEEAKVIPITESVSSPAPTETEGKE